MYKTRKNAKTVKMKRILFSLAALMCLIGATAADPTATKYSGSECEGSAMPYPAVQTAAYPDSLTPVMINHVGRHGARFPSSSRFTVALMRALNRADSLGTITPAGRQLMSLCNTVMSMAKGRWGALDSLGMAEQRAIASRMYAAYPGVFDNARIEAISSYSPRCIMSMDEFTHQIARLNNKVEIYTSSGRQNSPLVRFFDLDADYKEFMAGEAWHATYERFVDTTCPVTAIDRALGKSYPYEPGEQQDMALNEYKLVSGCAAMSLDVDWKKFFTIEEYNALWSCANMHHYLTHSASTMSTVPADMAYPLLQNLIETTDLFIMDQGAQPSVRLRFGHAETLMPLLSLMHIPGCYYMTNYFDTVGLHWRDFYIVPMGANLQMILFKSKSGNYYVRVDLNETPVPLIPGRTTIYTPWAAAREYLNCCIPLIYQE